jgi:predicted 2-oxoglutarate/Fe(II)-dependent dioxygenase YbiX
METYMISETVLRTLQERMRKLLDASAACAARDAELRAAVERARLTDPNETAREAAALAESERLMEARRALQDHINEAIRIGQDPALISDLKEELTELEGRRRELESGEEEHRHIADQAVRLRQHIESLSQN